MHAELIADFLDRVAALDDSPLRSRHAWFYADLARYAEELCQAAAEARDDGANLYDGSNTDRADSHHARRVNPHSSCGRKRTSSGHRRRRPQPRDVA